MNLRRTHCLLLTLTLFSCRAPVTNNALGLHILAVEHDGELKQFEVRQKQADGSGSVASKSTPGDFNAKQCVQQLLDAAEAEASRRLGPDAAVPLLIHIHGGLKSPEASRQQADDILTAIGQEENADWKYPLFVQWNSGPVSTSLDEILHLRQGRHLGLWGWISSPVIVVYDVTRGIVRAPRSLVYQWLRDASVAYSVATGDSPLQTWVDVPEIAKAANKDLTQGKVEDAVYSVRDSSYDRSTLEHSARLLAYFPMQLPKVATQVLVLDGLGQGAWDEMRRRAQALVWKVSTFETEKDKLSGPKLERSLNMARPNGALPVLMDAVERRMKAGKQYEVTLVGHSMGSMAINEVLPWIDEDFGVERVVYMAPACSVADAANAIVPFLQRHEEAQFHLLALNPLAEADEIVFFDAVPRGSLLEWIDNYYSVPASHVERVFGKWSNALPAITLFQQVRDRVHFKSFDVEPGSIPETHGDFNLIPFWRPECYEVDGKPNFKDDWLERQCKRALQSKARSW